MGRAERRSYSCEGRQSDVCAVLIQSSNLSAVVSGRGCRPPPPPPTPAGLPAEGGSFTARTIPAEVTGIQITAYPAPSLDAANRTTAPVLIFKDGGPPLVSVKRGYIAAPLTAFDLSFAVNSVRCLTMTMASLSVHPLVPQGLVGA